MLIIVKVKDTDNIIGLKEDVAMRLEGVADIERIDVHPSDGKDFYSPEEVRAMSQQQVRENYQVIMNSMKRWH